MCKWSFCGSSLSQAHPGTWPGCCRHPRLSGLPQASPEGPVKPGPAVPPLTALRVACLSIQPSPAQALGEVLLLAGSAHLQTLPWQQLQEVQKNKRPREGSHSVKGNQWHLKRKPCFPQCLFKWMGGGGPAVAPTLRTKTGPSAPRSWELGANSRLLQADPAMSVLLAGPQFKSESQKSMWKKKYQQQCFISCTQFMCIFLLFLVRNHYE